MTIIALNDIDVSIYFIVVINIYILYRDQFVLSEDGYGRHVGRIKEMIIRGGENIFPKEIEYFLESHPLISQAQVIIYTSLHNVFNLNFKINSDKTLSYKHIPIQCISKLYLMMKINSYIYYNTRNNAIFYI